MWYYPPLSTRKDTNLSCRECRGISLHYLASILPFEVAARAQFDNNTVPLFIICWLFVTFRATDGSCHEQRMEPHNAFHSENFSVRNSTGGVNDCLFTLDVRQSYLRLFARRLQTFHLQSLHWTLHWVSFFMRGPDANLSQIINGVCCPVDSITKPDHFWGIKFPKLLPKLFLTSPNWLDTIFIISKNLLNKNWMAC